MNAANNVFYLGKNRQGKKPRVMDRKNKELLMTCKSMLLEALKPLMNELFVKVDDDLYRLADTANNNAKQTLFFDAMRSLRLFREQAEKNYFERLEEKFEEFTGFKPLAKPMGLSLDEEEGGLSLIDKDDLETKLAVDTMVSKVYAEFNQDLEQLDQRVAFLADEKKIDPKENPLSPANLAHTFHDVLEEWEADVLAHLIVYRHFEKEVLFQLGDIYNDINHFLENAGILPDLKTKRRKIKPIGGSDKGESSQRDENIPSVEQLWEYIKPLTAAAMATNPNLPVAPKESVMKALTQIQDSALEGMDLENIDWEEFQKRIYLQLGQQLKEEEGEEKRIGDAEQKTIDVILALFNHILDDPNLPDAMRAHIARLQIPVLKAAIVDPSFVDNHEHPARRLLDTLAAASVGWQDNGDRSERSLYTQVKKAVDRIVHEFTDNIDLFEEVLNDFTAYLQKRERVKKILENRLTQSISGEEKMEVARLHVESVLENLEVDSLPTMLREMLHGPWKKLMILLLLREGEQGENWKKTVKIVDAIVKITGVTVTAANRQEINAHIIAILKGLKKGFEYISLDPNEAADLIEKVKNVLLEVTDPQKGEKLRQEILARKAAIHAKQHGGAEHLQTQMVDDEYMTLVNNMEEETWVRLKREEGENLLCKLVWRSKYTGTMVFVDGQGNKVAQIKDVELAEHFRKGRAEIVQDVETSLIDRAIKKMVKVLNAKIVGPKIELS